MTDSDSKTDANIVIGTIVFNQSLEQGNECITGDF
jgi:hypothetical protein